MPGVLASPSIDRDASPVDVALAHHLARVQEAFEIVHALANRLTPVTNPGHESARWPADDACAAEPMPTSPVVGAIYNATSVVETIIEKLRTTMDALEV